jgi:hypothetical protein
VKSLIVFTFICCIQVFVYTKLHRNLTEKFQHKKTKINNTILQVNTFTFLGHKILYHFISRRERYRFQYHKILINILAFKQQSLTKLSSKNKTKIIRKKVGSSNPSLQKQTSYETETMSFRDEIFTESSTRMNTF